MQFYEIQKKFLFTFFAAVGSMPLRMGLRRHHYRLLLLRTMMTVVVAAVMMVAGDRQTEKTTRSLVGERAAAEPVAQTRRTCWRS
jgi:hypothetical protein